MICITVARKKATEAQTPKADTHGQVDIGSDDDDDEEDDDDDDDDNDDDDGNERDDGDDDYDMEEYMEI